MQRYSNEVPGDALALTKPHVVSVVWLVCWHLAVWARYLTTYSASRRITSTLAFTDRYGWV